jgi:hypothetical protein
VERERAIGACGVGVVRVSERRLFGAGCAKVGIVHIAYDAKGRAVLGAGGRGCGASALGRQVVPCGDERARVLQGTILPASSDDASCRSRAACRGRGRRPRALDLYPASMSIVCRPPARVLSLVFVVRYASASAPCVP